MISGVWVAEAGNGGSERYPTELVFSLQQTCYELTTIDVLHRPICYLGLRGF